MASRTRKYRKKRGNRLEEFQHGTSMIIRIMKDILVTMSDVSTRLCSGLPSQIFERQNAFALELKAGFLFCHWRTTVIGLSGTCSGLSFSFFLFFFPFHKVVRRAELGSKLLTEIHSTRPPHSL